jgi:hypothetical protein
MNEVLIIRLVAGVLAVILLAVLFIRRSLAN